MVRAHEMTRPSRTSAAAWRRLAGVIRLSVPSSSSAPQRPQLLKDWNQPRMSCSVGSALTAVTADQVNLASDQKAQRGDCTQAKTEPTGNNESVQGEDHAAGEAAQANEQWHHNAP